MPKPSKDRGIKATTAATATIKAATAKAFTTVNTQHHSRMYSRLNRSSQHDCSNPQETEVSQINILDQSQANIFETSRKSIASLSGSAEGDSNKSK